VTYLLVRHKVKDFDAWKAVFDSHVRAQQEAGLGVERVLRNLDDPSEVVLLFEVLDLEKARGFVTSTDVPGAQTDSGVLDKPDIYFLSANTGHMP
jgi:hypothetical protein